MKCILKPLLFFIREICLIIFGIMLGLSLIISLIISTFIWIIWNPFSFYKQTIKPSKSFTDFFKILHTKLL